MTHFTLGGIAIGLDQPPFIIAEMSGNHNGQLERALALVDAAADAGAHALKLQTYTADMMTLDIREREFVIQNQSSPWFGRSLYDLYQEGATPLEWHAAIFQRAKERGILCFSSPFHAEAVALLEKLGAPAYKVASFECVDIPLIEACARTGKPLIISTGMADVGEIDDAVQAARKAGCTQLALLKGTSAYPAAPEVAHLRSIPAMRDLWQCEVGLSDHTMGIATAIAAVALGASIVEKHFTLARADGGVDSEFSLEPHELAELVSTTRQAHASLGRVYFGPSTDSEKHSRTRRRSLYVATDVKAGDVVSLENVRAIRPGLGLAPKQLERVLGKRFRTGLPKGTPLSWSVLDENHGD